MPRPHRIQLADGVYHLTSRSNVGRLVFESDAERAFFLGVLAETVARYSWSCRAYCLLSTHYHLLVATPQADIAEGMQYLKGRYAQWANWSREERGHVFEGRYKSILVRSEGHALEVHRYIAMNPVRAGLAKRPEAWRWSSTSALLGLDRPEPLLDVSAALTDFADEEVSARRRFRSFLRDTTLQDAA